RALQRVHGIGRRHVSERHSQPLDGARVQLRHPRFVHANLGANLLHRDVAVVVKANHFTLARRQRIDRRHHALLGLAALVGRVRRSANVSNLMPRPSSKRWAASIKPITPSCTRSPTSIEWGIVDAMRRASASTKGRPATTRRLWAAGIEWARIRFRLLEGAGGFR